MRRDGAFSPNHICRVDVQRGMRQAELGVAGNCHTLRPTGNTAWLLNGGSVENAQAMQC